MPPLRALERGVGRPFGRIFGSADDTAPVSALAVSGVAQMLVTATEKGIIQRWQWTDEAGWTAMAPIVHPPLLRPTPPATALHPAPDKSAVMKSETVAPAADASAAAVPSGYSKVRQQVLGLAISADGRLIATITDWDQATIWDAQSGEPLIRWTANRKGVPPSMQSNGAAIAFAADPDRPDHQLILTASYVADAIIWDWNEAEHDRPPEQLHVLEDPSLKGQPAGQRTHRFGVTTLAFSGDGRRAVTGSWDGTAKVWDVATGDPLYILGFRQSRCDLRGSARGTAAGWLPPAMTVTCISGARIPARQRRRKPRPKRRGSAKRIDRRRRVRQWAAVRPPPPKPRPRRRRTAPAHARNHGRARHRLRC